MSKKNEKNKIMKNKEAREILQKLQALQIQGFDQDVYMDIDIMEYSHFNGVDFQVFFKRQIFSIENEVNYCKVEILVKEEIMAELIAKEVRKIELLGSQKNGENSTVADLEFTLDDINYSVKATISYEINYCEGDNETPATCDIVDISVNVERPVDENWNKLFLTNKSLKYLNEKINQKL